MSNEEKRNDWLLPISLACHPVKYKILFSLFYGPAKEVPLYITEIAKRIKEERRKVSFYLTSLEEKGLVESEFAIIKEPYEGKGKAGRFYKLTEKGGTIMGLLWSGLRQIDFGIEQVITVLEAIDAHHPLEVIRESRRESEFAREGC